MSRLQRVPAYVVDPLDHVLDRADHEVLRDLLEHEGACRENYAHDKSLDYAEARLQLDEVPNIVHRQVPMLQRYVLRGHNLNFIIAQFLVVYAF